MWTKLGRPALDITMIKRTTVLLAIDELLRAAQGMSVI
jgi:hypothetical protein